MCQCQVALCVLIVETFSSNGSEGTTPTIRGTAVSAYHPRNSSFCHNRLGKLLDNSLHLSSMYHHLRDNSQFHSSRYLACSNGFLWFPCNRHFADSYNIHLHSIFFLLCSNLPPHCSRFHRCTHNNHPGSTCDLVGSNRLHRNQDYYI